MQFFKSKVGGIITVFILVMAVLFVREPRLITETNSWLINDTFDGFRTYAAMQYHILHDSTYLHYEGMNYPYGDKAAYTDNLPLISNAVKFISRHIIDISPYTSGILNGVMILSVILGAVFIFLIFNTLKLPNAYAVPVSIGIVLLSPQLLRMSAHYGLAHPFVIPLLFWLSLLFHKNKRWSLSFGIAVALFLIAQLHFYLFAIGGGFIIALMAFKTFFGFSKKAVLINGLHLLIQVLLPLFLLQWQLSDEIADRPTKPYGFFAYRAYWESVFLPVDFKTGKWINENLLSIRTFDREGIAFIGTVALLFLMKEFLLKLWNRIFGKEYFTILPEENRFFLKSAFWASFSILIFSLGLPFTISGLEVFQQKLGVLNQFRSIGRFAWVFFYVINIIIFYALYFQVKRIKKHAWQLLVYSALILILLSEGLVFLFQKVELPLYAQPAIRADFQKSDNAWLDKINPDEFQGILTVPFFHIGSENIWISPKGKEVHRTLWLSVQTGLAVNSSFMGRTSVTQVINQLELNAIPYRSPKILQDLASDKDFLIFVYKSSYETVKHRYTYLLADLKAIHEDDLILVYRISPSEWEKRIASKVIEIRNEYSNSRLFDFGEIKSTDSIRNFVYLNYDDQEAESIYQGTGAFQGKGKAESVIFDGHIPFQQADMKYEFSIWAYIYGDLYPKIRVTFEEYQAGTNQILHRKEIELYKDFKAFDKGWMLSGILFEMTRPDSRLRIKVFNNDLGDRLVFLDELMIRPERTNLFLEDGKAMNNLWLEKE